MGAAINIHNIKAIAAKSDNVRNYAWATLDIQTSEGRCEVTLFFATRDMADAIANAINYANASASVQTHHDKRLSDAGLEEYRSLITEIA